MGEKLKTMRESQKISRKKLADMTGCSYNHILLIERGERNPSWGLFLRLCDALNITWEIFFYPKN